MVSTSHAVILGGGLAGALAAVAAAEGVDKVTVIEQDQLPAEPSHRKGLPQGRHAHIMVSGGATAVESLLPGTIEGWLAAGARRINLAADYLALNPAGWLRRWPDLQWLICCSRPLLDWVIGQRLAEQGRVEVLSRSQAVGLVGDADRVVGARVRSIDSGATTQLDADLVVDATGRSSQATTWLTQLGLPPVREAVVDPGLAYATRIFRAPPGLERFPVINIQVSSVSGRAGSGALLMPIENDRWLVTVGGTRGGEPTTNDEDFEKFARSVRHPLIADLIAAVEPLTSVQGSRSTANRRRYFERAGRWPDGFVVVGDAVATFNPIYGHGMAVAALDAVALRDVLRRRGLERGTARRVQLRIGETVASAWAMATNQDVFYPDVIGPRPGAVARMRKRFLDRQLRAAHDHRVVASALMGAFTLSTPMNRLISPAVLLATLRGSSGPPTSTPPLTDEELAVVNGL